MSRIVQFGFLFFVALLFSNCKQAELDPNLIINVDDDFYIDMFEDISDGGSIFKINFQSIQKQDCQNAIIDYDLQFDDENSLIILSINDILPPETCIEESAPAFVSVPLGNLGNPRYTIEINLKDAIINQGYLLVTDTDFYLGMDTEDGFEVVHKTLNRIPKKLIWGYVGYEEQVDETEANNFVTDLEDISTNINNIAGFNSGYFGYFTILENQSIELNNDIEERYHTPFVFQYDADNQDVIDLIVSYCNQHPELNIHLFNGEGDKVECP